MKKFSILILSTLMATVSWGNPPAFANGSQDPNFNSGNYVIQSGGDFQEATVIAFQGDEILLAGSRDNDFMVARFTTSGQLDTTFGTAGYVTVDISPSDFATGLAVTSSREIYVYGTASSDIAIVKLSENGSRINAFGVSGVLVVNASDWGAYSLASADIEIFEDSIYFAAALRLDGGGGTPGAFRYSLFRMDPTGDIDELFSNLVLGLSIDDGYLGAMTIDANENIYLAGNEHTNPISRARVVKIDSAGSLLNTFDADGVLEVAITSKQDSSQIYNALINELRISSNGQIFAVGYITEPNYEEVSEVFILNFNSLGTVSPFGTVNSTGLFDSNKEPLFADRQSIAIQNDGKFLVSLTWGNISGFNGVVARFTTSGDLDPSFGTEGLVDFPTDFSVNTIQMHSSQKLVAAGRNGDASFSDIFISRLRTAIPSSAPIIGTATSTGSSSATISFTAPISNGGSAITSYTATSSLGGFTGTLLGSTAGTITVTGLSASTAYTFTVTATNSEGTSIASSASNSITTSAAASGTGSGTAAEELRRQQEAASAAKQKQDQELREILSLVPSIAGLAQGISGLGNSLLLQKKCVKGKLVKNVKAGVKCPKGYKARR
jgi:uncharacterized delta-60 repeat protein